VQNETVTEFMKSLTKTDERIAQIAAYYRRLDASVASFQVRDAQILAQQDTISCFHSQITSLVNIQDRQTRNDEARLKDQKALHDRLNDLDSTQNRLKEMLSMFYLLFCPRLVYNRSFTLLGAQSHSMEAMRISLQKILEERSGGDRELEFVASSVRYLSIASRHHMRRESWMITSFDIEYGREIGSGG